MDFAADRSEFTFQLAQFLSHGTARRGYRRGQTEEARSSEGERYYPWQMDPALRTVLKALVQGQVNSRKARPR